MTRFILGDRGDGKEWVDVQRLVDTRLLIQANSGGGKSWCLRRILEQTHGRLQHLIIDLEGEFASLREKFDYVLAAKAGGDTAAEPRGAKLLAERLLELGVSAILDIYELKREEREAFVKGFLEALVNAPKRLWHPALVVVDEAHIFCPEKGSAASAAAVIDLATRGRKRGFAAVLATQRLAKLHKDAAAECNNKLIGRTGLDVDLARAANELGFGKNRWTDLRRLRAGEFFAFGPAISLEVELVRVGTVETTHPKAGARLTFAAPPPTAKVKALLPQLADLPAKAEQRERSMQELKREISTLKRELRKKPAPPVAEVEHVEVPVVGKDELARLEASVSAFAKYSDGLQGELGALSSILGQIGVALAKVGRNGHETTKGLRRAGTPATRPPRERKPAGAPAPSRAVGKQEAATDLLPAKRRILDALAFLEGIGVRQANKTQLALLVGVSPTSGGYFNNLGSLRSAGLIEYPAPSEVALTEAGRPLADASSAPSTDEELHEAIRRKLPPAKWKLLEQLIALYPEDIPKDELAERVGVRPTSGGYFNNLGSLRSLGLIDYPAPGHVVAQSVLFLEA